MYMRSVWRACNATLPDIGASRFIQSSENMVAVEENLTYHGNVWCKTNPNF